MVGFSHLLWAMLKRNPIVFTLLLACLGLVFFSGCSRRQSMNPYKQEEFNLLGVYRSKPASFRPTSKVTLPISTKDVMLQRENFSGQERSFLWGLITVTDY
jgi:hypothetical protein